MQVHYINHITDRMPHPTSGTRSSYAQAGWHSMSPSDSVLIEEGQAAAEAGGFSLLLDEADEHPSSEDVHGNGLLSNGKDISQIDAALATLNKPRISVSSLTYGTPGEKKETNSRPMSPDEARKRTQYFEDQFAYKDDQADSVRGRVQKDSPVIAELRTNVIVKDEYTLVTDMSYHLSTRFSRPESAIMINVDHSACLLHAGSFEPAYLLTISALSSQMQPTTNKRNAALIQSFMADVLSVPPERGVVRFLPIPEENLASNGTTVFGEIERIEKLQAEEQAQNPTKRTFTRGSRKSVINPRRQSLKPEPLFNGVPTPSISNISLVASPLPSLSTPKQPVYGLATDEKRKSMTGVLKGEKKPLQSAMKDGTSSPNKQDSKRKSQSHTATPNPPPIPQELPQTQKVSKRKSFLAVFRKS